MDINVYNEIEDVLNDMRRNRRINDQEYTCLCISLTEPIPDNIPPFSYTKTHS